jgi:hypothetical protein
MLQNQLPGSRHSAYVFVGGLDYELTEGDVLAVFAQYGEIVDVHLVRDKATGRQGVLPAKAGRASVCMWEGGRGNVEVDVGPLFLLWPVGL